MSTNWNRDINFLLRKYYQTTPSGKPLTHLPRYDCYEKWSNESICEYIEESRKRQRKEIMEWMCRKYKVNKEMQEEATYILENINLLNMSNWSVEENATMLLLYLRTRDNPKYLSSKHYENMLKNQGLSFRTYAAFLTALVGQIKDM